MHETANLRRVGRPVWPARAAVLIGAGLLLSACAGAPAVVAPEPQAHSACFESRLGCATEHNLAVLAAHPADLARPRRLTRRDPIRRDTMLAAYAHGQAKEREPKAGVARLNGATQ